MSEKNIYDRKYYNKEQKIDFLKSLESQYQDTSIDRISMLLSRLRDVEQEYGDDLCNFSLKYAKLTFVLKATTSSKFNTKQLSFIMKYVEWCEANGKCKFGNDSKWNMVDLNDIDLDYVYKIQTVKSPEHFQELLESVYQGLYGDVFQSEMGYIYKTVLYLLYLGVKDDEVGYILKSDVDCFNKIIKINDRVIPIDDYMIACIQEIWDYTHVQKRVTNGKFNSTALIDSPYLIKKTKSGRPIANTTNRVDKEWVQWKCSEFSKRYRQSTGEAIVLPAKKIYDSGVFYKLLQREQAGEKITVDEVVPFYSHFHISTSYSKLIDYKAWKQAYYG